MNIFPGEENMLACRGKLFALKCALLHAQGKNKAEVKSFTEQ